MSPDPTTTSDHVDLPALPGRTNELAVGVATKLGVWATAVAGLGTVVTGATAAATSHAEVLGVPPETLLKVSVIFGTITAVGRYGQAIFKLVADLFATRRGQ